MKGTQMNPTWMASTTAARPCGECWQCGGTLYENLYHSCTTVARVTFPWPQPTPSEAGGNKPIGDTSSDAKP